MITIKELYDATIRDEGPLAKHAAANPDMPCFLLLGQDQNAADLVEKWAIWVSVGVQDCNDRGRHNKVQEANLIADMMRRWPIHKVPD